VSGERTEKPTAKRLREARREGRIGRTPDLGSWAGMLVASVLLPMVVRRGSTTARELLDGVRAVIAHPEPARAVGLLGHGLRGAALAVAPLALGLLLVGVAASAAQGGIRPATKLLRPKLSRLNPMAGFKRTFGVQSLWGTAKAVVKTAVLGLVLYSTVRRITPALLAPGAMPLDQTLGTIAGAVLSLIRTAAAAGLVMAAADYAVVRRRTNKQLRMTKQEVKEEHRHSDGDPHVRAAIRSRQLAMSRNRMMAELAKADVVVVNPTHVAVALRYDPARGAPRVVAKGAGAVAARIREAASEHRIPMVQDVPLARALHKACELGQEIPADLYAAVARVLAFVMTLKARGSAAGVHRPPALLAG
jgi:flagellar biosynthesis protein FlhB